MSCLDIWSNIIYQLYHFRYWHSHLIESPGPMWSMVKPAFSRAIWTLCLPRKWLAPKAKKYRFGFLFFSKLIIFTTHCSFRLQHFLLFGNLQMMIQLQCRVHIRTANPELYIDILSRTWWGERRPVGVAVPSTTVAWLDSEAVLRMSEGWTSPIQIAAAEAAYICDVREHVIVNSLEMGFAILIC